MNSTSDWWKGDINWGTPSGKLLRDFIAALPRDREFEITVYGSAPLQLTVDKTLLSGDIDVFALNDEDLAPIVDQLGLGKEAGGLHIEAGFELSFRTSPRWRTRAKKVRCENATLYIPHPIDILIGKLARLEPKDLTAFRAVIAATGHPTSGEFKAELQNAVDLYRPNFDEDSPNCYPKNTERLWREVFNSEIDVRTEIIAVALARRKQGYGETPTGYKDALGRSAAD